MLFSLPNPSLPPSPCATCSILQCLSNTEPLMRYFDSGSFKDEINTDNVLGHGGLLATAYAKLVKDMWCDAYSKVGRPH